MARPGRGCREGAAADPSGAVGGGELRERARRGGRRLAGPRAWAAAPASVGRAEEVLEAAVALPCGVVFWVLRLQDTELRSLGPGPPLTSGAGVGSAAGPPGLGRIRNPTSGLPFRPGVCSLQPAGTAGAGAGAGVVPPRS